MFKELEGFEIIIQKCSMLPEHLLPMIQVEDKDSTEIVTQIFNFVDYCGGAQKITIDSLKTLLQSKGIPVDVDEGKFGKIESEKLDAKDQETYYIANMSSYMNEAALDDEAVEKLNEQLMEIDDM